MSKSTLILIAPDQSHFRAVSLSDAANKIASYLFDEGYELPDGTPVREKEEILFKTIPSSRYLAYAQRDDRIFDTQFYVQEVPVIG